ncbi:hypothetical protein BDZ94DRAFT_1186166 [Collybia nuda]|uniref:DUF1308 domain-containing protein n=1 Tax=Collybia nuda TaxID=64659 RepID=A0A9P6CI36_9AGAR|nr:hypothetical protein BDZ94DRAFT_1186166 [Collybia nuda]
MTKNIDDIEPHSGLQQLRTRLQDIYDAISSFQPLTAKPPILDSSLDIGGDPSEDGQWLQQEHIPGLKKLRDSIKIDLDVLEKFLNDPNSVHLPPLSTNAPYLIAVWNEILCGPSPIESVFKSMPLSPADPLAESRQRGGQRPPAAKVDVVANHGKRWIRVNTIKNARILAEFREIDSYLTDSEDELYDELEDARPTLAQTEFDNSVLRMGRSLLAAAKSNPIEGTTEIPRITLRLTRLNPSLFKEGGDENDPRIAQTVRCLEDMGIDVELGERGEEELPVKRNPKPMSLIPPAPLEPTLHINLDLSVLIALISDLTHSPLPKTIEEASIRFIPPQEYREWKKKKNGFLAKRKPKTKAVIPATEEATEGEGVNTSDIPKDMVKHSRALTNQLLQEMGKGLLQEIHDRISAFSSRAPEANVKFWTTPEARERCLRIISKIGGPSEKRRAHAMFSAISKISDQVLSPSQAEDAYWQDSRYPPKFIALFPINIYPSSPSPDASLVSEARSPPLPRFFRSLGKTCQDILAQETVPHPRSFPEDVNGEALEYKGEIQRATVTKANPRLTAHTVQSLLWGAELGWTTLTANKTSIRAILREIKIARVSGRLEEDILHTDEIVEDNKVAIWIVDPRSLAEGMSSHTPSVT